MSSMINLLNRVGVSSSRLSRPANQIRHFTYLSSLHRTSQALSPSLARHSPSSPCSSPHAHSRTYAKKSIFSPTELYKTLIKQSMAGGSWEVADYEGIDISIKPHQSTARKLKQQLAASPDSNTLQYSAIKALLIQLLQELPAYDPGTSSKPSASPFYKNKSLIANTFSILLSTNEPSGLKSSENNDLLLPSHLSADDLNQLYFLMVEKSGDLFSKDGAVPIIPNLFSLLNASATQLSKEDPSINFETSILPVHLTYFKYLNAQSKVNDSEQYLKWLLGIHHPQSNPALFDMFLRSMSFHPIQKACIPLLFNHLFTNRTSKQLESKHAADPVTTPPLMTPSNQSFVYALTNLYEYPKVFSQLADLLLSQYPHLYEVAPVVSVIFDVLNNKIRKAEASRSFLQKFLEYHNNGSRPITELDQVLRFDDDQQKLAFHRQLALAFIKYGPEIISASNKSNQSSGILDQKHQFEQQIASYLDVYIPSTFESRDIQDIKLFIALSKSNPSSTSDEIVSIFRQAVEGEDGLNITHKIINNSFDILCSRGFDIEKNFDQIHEYFELELNFESSIDTFECLILGALNGNIMTEGLDSETGTTGTTGTTGSTGSTGSTATDSQRASAERALLFFEKSVSVGTFWDKASRDQLETLDNMLISLCQAMPDDVFKIFKAYQRVRMFVPNVGYNAQAELLKLFLSYNYVGDVERFISDELGEKDRRGMSWSIQPELYQPLFKFACECSDYKDAWAIYGLTEKYFDPPFENYFKIMTRFCELGRPDAAQLIFKNLRNRSRTQGGPPPTAEMYALLFREFGRSGYVVGVDELHTLYRVDILIEPSLPLLNSILEAYTFLDDPENAIEIWSQIKDFPGGPDNHSYTNLLKLCTKASIHDVENMWQQLLQDPNVQVSEANVKQYLVANCYHGFYARALEIAKSVTQGTLAGIAETPNLLTSGSSSDGPAVKFELSESTLAALYNWTLVKSRKEDVAEWARATFPDKWENLRESGALQMYLVDEENPNRDSDSNLRHGVHEQMSVDGMLVGGTAGKNILPHEPDLKPHN